MDFGAIDTRAHLFPVVIFVFAVAIGIELTVAQFRALLRKPRIPILGTIIHTLTFPLLSVSLVTLLLFLQVSLEPHLILGVLLVAACPSGGFSNMLVLLARADLALSVLLTSVSSLLSFVTVPLLFASFGLLVPALSGEVRLPVVETLLNLLVLVVVPVGVGMGWRAWRETFVVRHTRLIQNIAQVLLYLVCLLLLIEQWDGMKDSVGMALPLSIALCIAALATGYGLSRLVKLSPTDAATVAIEGSIRNLAVAFLIASTVLEDVRIALVPSVYFVAVLIVGLTFARFWRVRVAPGLRSVTRDDNKNLENH